MERFIIEKREATGKEKASCSVYSVERKGIILPQYLGIEEAENRLNDGIYYPCVFVTKKSGYIPKRFRNDNYIIL